MRVEGGEGATRDGVRTGAAHPMQIHSPHAHPPPPTPHSHVVQGRPSRPPPPPTHTHTGRSGLATPSPRWHEGGIRLVALDLDGTLLDGSSRILPSSVKVRL